MAEIHFGVFVLLAFPLCYRIEFQLYAGIGIRRHLFLADSAEKVGAGSKFVTEAGSTMEEIAASVQRVTVIMAEIVAASQEQCTGIGTTNHSIAQMDQVTQQNAVLGDPAANAAESLYEQARTWFRLFRYSSLNNRVNGEAVLGQSSCTGSGY